MANPLDTSIRSMHSDTHNYTMFLNIIYVAVLIFNKTFNILHTNTLHVTRSMELDK